MKMKATTLIALCGLGLASVPGAGTAQDNLVYTAIEGCRVLDTRNWNQATPQSIPGLRAVELHLSDENGDISAQGGDPSGCPAIPDDAEAFAVTVSAIAPNFPSSPFSGAGYAVIVPFDQDQSDWSAAGTTPGGNGLYSNTDPPFNPSATVLFDNDTDIITNTTMVEACEGCAFHARVYTSTAAHFTVDVVGYYDIPGCGTYKPLTGCPLTLVGSDGPKCDEVLPGAFCEGDGECGTSDTLNNCSGPPIVVPLSTQPSVIPIPKPIPIPDPIIIPGPVQYDWYLRVD